MAAMAPRIVLAPDAFKGSLTAPEAAAAMARGVRAVWPDARIDLMPVADGGEGTLDLLCAATSGRSVPARVTGPDGSPVEARWAVLGDGRTAVVESACACGLSFVPADRLVPARLETATTRGVGELIREALDAGLRRVVVGCGGSATNDAGTGAARALGARFLDAAGRDLPDGGRALADLARADFGDVDPRLAVSEVIVACDVADPLLGPSGASRRYGPQKGADPETACALDAALARFAAIAGRACGRDLDTPAGAGAGGGLAAGLLACAGASLVPGAEFLLDALGVDQVLRGADLVITGEGRTDAQTARGKAPLGVARRARAAGVPVVCLSGALGDGADALLDLGVTALAAVVPGPSGAATAMVHAGPWLEAAAARVCRLIALGRHMAQ